MFSAGFIEFTIGLYWFGSFVNGAAYILFGSERQELLRRIQRLEQNNINSYHSAYRRNY